MKETAASYFTANPILEPINSVITVSEPIDRNYNVAAGLWRTPFKPSKSSRPLPLPTHTILPRLLPGHQFQAQVQEQDTNSSLSPVISPSTDSSVLPSTTPALLLPTAAVLLPPPSPPSVLLPVSATDAISSALTLKLSFQEITRVVQKYSAKQLQSLAILKEAIEREERESKEMEAANKRKREDAEASAVQKTTKNPPF
jgi:hypothetical protein